MDIRTLALVVILGIDGIIMVVFGAYVIKKHGLKSPNPEAEWWDFLEGRMVPISRVAVIASGIFQLILAFGFAYVELKR